MWLLKTATNNRCCGLSLKSAVLWIFLLLKIDARNWAIKFEWTNLSRLNFFPLLITRMKSVMLFKIVTTLGLVGLAKRVLWKATNRGPFELTSDQAQPTFYTCIFTPCVLICCWNAIMHCHLPPWVMIWYGWGPIIIEVDRWTVIDRTLEQKDHHACPFKLNVQWVEKHGF